MFPSPIVVAPMAGGTSTVDLVVAAARAGGFGYLAAGYKSAQALAGQVAQVRAAGVDFGVNVFVPGTIPPDAGALAVYRQELEAEAAAYGVDLPPVFEDDDGWQEKIDLLASDPVPLVSFTFGLPPASVVRRLQQAGSRVIASVTGVEEAELAAETGVDALTVQHQHAGSHTAAFLPPSRHAPAPDTAALVSLIRHAVELPLIGAGGLGSPADIKPVLAAGAVAVQLGTAFIRTAESGARQLHKDALADPQYTETVLTRAFTGKPARALANRFVRDHPYAPAGYPAIHHLTAPIRAAAAAQGDAGGINLWAGTSWRQARDVAAGEVVEGFLREL